MDAFGLWTVVTKLITVPPLVTDRGGNTHRPTAGAANSPPSWLPHTATAWVCWDMWPAGRQSSQVKSSSL